jgi:hypothetical protein
VLLGVELIDEEITELQFHTRVQYNRVANGLPVPQREPARLDLLFLYAGR